MRWAKIAIAVLNPTATPTANQVSYIVADHLGTPQLASNSSGTTDWYTTYQPFGTTGNVNASIIQDLRFPGQNMDVETGFSYNVNRDYMPNTGRYLESDPVGLWSGINPFNYVRGQPFNAIDPLGLWQFTIGGGLGFGAEVTFGNNGGSGPWWVQPLNGQWNLGAYFGGGAGLSGSLVLANSGCTEKAGTMGIIGAFDFKAGAVSGDISGELDTSGTVSVEGGAGAGPVEMKGTLSTNGKSVQASATPSVGLGMSGFAGIGGDMYFGGPASR